MEDVERLEPAWAFKPEHLWYITCIFEDTSDSRFCLWDIQKYKEVTEFIKKLRVCDMDVLSQEYIITYESLVQEATREYRNLVDSKRWEPATNKSLRINRHSQRHILWLLNSQSTRL